MTAHIDTFARDNLPPREQWPQFRFELPELQFPPQLNCAAELLDRWVERGAGARPCLISDDLQWSYAELRDEANRIAWVLVEDLGLVPGNRVLLRAPNSPLLAACWLAVVKAGGIAVGSMPLLRAKELTQIVGKARISHALCDERLADELELAQRDCSTLTRVLHFDQLRERTRHKPTAFRNEPTAADDTCLIAFTSGTTGVPKGTMHFHRDVMAACACWPRHVLKPKANDRFIGSPPLAFTFGLGGLLLFPLSVGASSVLLEKVTPPALLAGIERHQASICVTAPTSYRAMAPLVPHHDLRSLRRCVSAGEALPAPTRAAWKQATRIELIDGIGATEMLHIFISHDEAHAKPGATGTPVPGYTACVLGDDGQPLPKGQVGRLAVIGPTGCRYLDDERQTQYVQHGWNVTGDAYRIDPDGTFVYQARTDDMIVSGGYNIAGPEVETALLAHPAVAECAVIGVPDDERGQRVQAYVVLREGQVGDAAMTRALQDHVKQAIAPYKYPRAIEYRASLPRTETGKLQRYKLKGEPT